MTKDQILALADTPLRMWKPAEALDLIKLALVGSRERRQRPRLERMIVTELEAELNDTRRKLNAYRKAAKDMPCHTSRT